MESAKGERQIWIVICQRAIDEELRGRGSRIIGPHKVMLHTCGQCRRDQLAVLESRGRKCEQCQMSSAIRRRKPGFSDETKIVQCITVTAAVIADVVPEIKDMPPDRSAVPGQPELKCEIRQVRHKIRRLLHP